MESTPDIELDFHNLRSDLTADDLSEWLRSEGFNTATAVIHVSFFKPEGFLLPSDILISFLALRVRTRLGRTFCSSRGPHAS